MSISAAGASLPNDIQTYDVRVSSFTVAAGSTTSPYVIPGTTKPLNINPVINVTPASGTLQLATSIGWIAYALITTNTTDGCDLGLQKSLDNGATWTTAAASLLTIDAASQNKSITVQQPSSAAGQIDIDNATPVTNNVVLLRLIVTDATSPTTDALTLTNIRVTIPFQVTR
jgi:hypothetical protein